MQEREQVENCPPLRQPEASRKPISYLQKRIKDYNDVDFLRDYPDPEKNFSDPKKWESATYRTHVRVYLYNKFTDLSTGVLDKTISACKYSLTAAYKKLKRIAAKQATPASDPSVKLHIPRPPQPMPTVPDDYFYDECMFVRNRSDILDQVSVTQASLQCRVEEARAGGELQTCPCCFHEDVIPEHMLSCPAGHAFCTLCIQTGTEAALGNGKTYLECMDPTCSELFSLSTLRAAARPKTMAILEKRIAENEIRVAGITLEYCPFCPFSCDMSENTSNIFQCPNEECLKESCRECRRLRHDPEDCDTLGRQQAMRAFIENHITNVTIRTCHKCGCQFRKHGGCNVMACPCGARMCYVCRKPLDGPGDSTRHFDMSNTKCNVYDEELVHYDELKRAAEHAKLVYLERHPAAANITINLDELLPETPEDPAPPSSTTQQHRTHPYLLTRLPLEHIPPPPFGTAQFQIPHQHRALSRASSIPGVNPHPAQPMPGQLQWPYYHQPPPVPAQYQTPRDHQ